MNGLIRSLFFGNYFYGICAIALSVEASLQQHVPLNDLIYYLFIFSATVLYYTHAYIAEKGTVVTTPNKRAAWYIANRKAILGSQLFLTLVLIVTGSQLGIVFTRNISHITALQWVLIALFPVTGALYYGNIQPGSTGNLRNNGWLKPFVIGFVWAGAVTIYPGLWKSIENDSVYQPGIVSMLLFIKNFMFVSVLCIMFDIKDYSADHNHRLKTFVVRFGLRRTIFYILIPLSMIGLGTFIVYAMARDFPLLRILVNIIPFILLIIVAYSLHQRKSILYYLAIIDGLMLVKALCGIVGISLIK